MASLPVIQIDNNIIDICESVATEKISLHDGIEYIGDQLKELLGDCRDINKISVYSIRLVEVLIPTSVGVFMDEEDMLKLWEDEQLRHHPSPLLLFTFVVLSCMQLTSTGPKREGAKTMGQHLDKVLPEDDEIDQLNRS